MDLLLERFLADGYCQLDAADRRRFDDLLARPDQDLYAWIAGQGSTPDARFERLVSLIRACTVDNA